MIRMKQIVLGLLVALLGSSAFAACPNLPNNLQNGQTADAAQVMANFNALLSCINNGSALRGYLGGLTLANDVTLTKLDISAGEATSDDAATRMILGSAWVKSIGSTFTLGSGNGGLDTGSVTASTWYHVFLISDSTGVTTDILFSTSLSPSMPGGFTKKRRIGSIRTDGSSNIIKFTQNGDLFLLANAISGQWDQSNIATSSTGTLVAVNVPPGVSVEAILNVAGELNTTYVIYSPFQTLAATAPWNLGTNTANFIGGQFRILTNTNAQVTVGSNPSQASGFYLSAVGWVDTRGRFS
jgi:hypothetical protein